LRSVSSYGEGMTIFSLCLVVLLLYCFPVFFVLSISVIGHIIQLLRFIIGCTCNNILGSAISFLAFSFALYFKLRGSGLNLYPQQNTTIHPTL
jgi:hypothetical protein